MTPGTSTVPVPSLPGNNVVLRAIGLNEPL